MTTYSGALLSSWLGLVFLYIVLMSAIYLVNKNY